MTVDYEHDRTPVAPTAEPWQATDEATMMDIAKTLRAGVDLSEYLFGPAAPAINRPKQLPATPDTDITDENWRLFAACLAEDPDMFYEKRSEREAKAVCVGKCAVREQCLNLGFRAANDYGVWGGLNPKELRTERKRRDRAQARTVRGV